MKTPKIFVKAITLAGVGGCLTLGLSVQAQPSVTTTVRVPVTSSQIETKNPMVVRIEPARVLDSSGIPVGKVENLVLSPAGCTEAAIITSDRGRLTAVPWKIMRLSGETRGEGEVPGSTLVFTVNANSDRIDAAPSFARDQWPNVSTAAWLQPSVTYFRTDAAGGTVDYGTVIGTGSSVDVLVITNNTGPGNTLQPTGRIAVDPTPYPPVVPPVVNPGPGHTPISVAPPPGRIPLPVTPPPPSTVPPDNFPRPIQP